jgi:hypothetical protein
MREPDEESDDTEHHNDDGDDDQRLFAARFLLSLLAALVVILPVIAMLRIALRFLVGVILIGHGNLLERDRCARTTYVIYQRDLTEVKPLGLNNILKHAFEIIAKI